MARPRNTVVVLDEKVRQARARLQYTTETDPALERRISDLVALVARRDLALYNRPRRSSRQPEPDPFPPTAA